MSVFFKDEIDANPDVTWRDIEAAVFPQQIGKRVPCVLTVQQLRDEGQRVFREPLPLFPGHGEVLDTSGRKRSSGCQSRLAKAARWPADIEEVDYAIGVDLRRPRQTFDD